jgi:hypothetical protein
VPETYSYTSTQDYNHPGLVTPSIDNNISNSTTLNHSAKQHQRLFQDDITTHELNSILCREKFGFPPVPGIRVRDICNTGVFRQPKINISDKTCISLNRILEGESSTQRRNICMPKGRESVDDFEPVTFVKDKGSNEDSNGQSSQSTIIRIKSSEGGNSLSPLAEILLRLSCITNMESVCARTMFKNRCQSSGFQ